MGISDFFGIIGAIIDPTSSYEEMQEKIESNKEDVIKDCHHEVESVEPEQDVNDFVTDVMNDFDDISDSGNGKSFATDNFYFEMEDLNDLTSVPDSCLYWNVDPSESFKVMEAIILHDNDDDPKEIEDISFDDMEQMPKLDIMEDCILQDGESTTENE